MQGPEGAGKFSSSFSAIAIRWLWLGMIALFVSLSLPKLFRATAKTSVQFVGPFHSTDTFLHFDTGEINASERLVDLFGSIPSSKKVVIFVRNDDRRSVFVGMLIAYLAWPHPVRTVDVTQSGWETAAAEADFRLVGEFVFCHVAPPESWTRGERFGDTLQVFSAANVAQR